MTHKPKILLISHSSNKVGGGEDDFARILNYLQGKFIIYSFFPDGDRAEEYAKLSDKHLIIPGRIFPGDKFNIKTALAFVFFTAKKVIMILNFFRKNKNIDLCFVNSSVCIVEMLLLKFLRKPYVISIKEKLNPAFLRKYVYKIIDKSASKIIVISEFLKSLLKETIKNKEVRIIRASIEEDLCKKFISVTTVPQNKNKFNILNIGQIYPMKNQLLLIEAAGRLKNKNSVLIKFIGFVVDKKYYNYLLRKINDLRLQNLFEFRGALNKNEIFYEYLNSDAVVITAKEEGMSLVFVEALFFEKPVISTKVGVVPEVLVNGENGIILDEINSDMLAESIDNLIDNKILYNKFRNNSRITFENNFNLEKNLEEHLEIFYECINKKY